jgi:hypothetical protein
MTRKENRYDMMKLGIDHEVSRIEKLEYSGIVY